MCRIVILICLCALGVNGATILVPSGVSTIQAAHNGTLNPGDTIIVDASAYTGDERVSWTKDGSSGNFITVVSVNGRALMKGFALNGVSYVKIVNFEIRHTDSSFADGINNVGVSSNLEIVDNYIHDVLDRFIGNDGTLSYTAIRGNTNWYSGHPGSLGNPDVGFGSNPTPGTSHHLLSEYNTLQRSGDYMYLFGSNNISRNDFLNDTTNSYWNEIGMHWDGFQEGSDGGNSGPLKNRLIEACIVANIRGPDGHFGLWQNTVNAGDSNVVIRGSVGYKLATGGIGMIGTDGMRTYNNTFAFTPIDENVGTITFYQQPFVNALIANTIIYKTFSGTGIDAISIQTGTGIQTNNMGYVAGTEPSYISTADPDFVNTNIFDFRVNAGSVAINNGTNYCWVTSSTGSGTSFNVTDAYLFCDGWGLIEGDVITVGSTTTRITSIVVNTITVADSISWVNGASVYWGSDSTPDLGAIPYGTVRLTYATIAQNGTTYTVTPTGTTRGVWFYVNGIPTTWDYVAPYQATIASGTVTAKAYALYAQINPVVNATAADESVYNLSVSGTMSVGNLNIAQ